MPLSMEFSPVSILGIRIQFLFLVLEQLINKCFQILKMQIQALKALSTVQVITES